MKKSKTRYITKEKQKQPVHNKKQNRNERKQKITNIGQKHSGGEWINKFKQEQLKWTIDIICITTNSK